LNILRSALEARGIPLVSCCLGAGGIHREHGGGGRGVSDILARLLKICSEESADEPPASSPARLLVVTDFSSDYAHHERCVQTACDGAVQRSIEIIGVEHGSVVSMMTSGLYPAGSADPPSSSPPQPKRRRLVAGPHEQREEALHPADDISPSSSGSGGAKVASPVEFISFYASFEEAVLAALNHACETPARAAARAPAYALSQRNTALATRLCSSGGDDAFISLERWSWVGRAAELYSKVYESFLRQPFGPLVCCSVAWWRGGEGAAASIVDQLEENMTRATENWDIYPGGLNIAFRAFEDLFEAGVLSAEGVIREVFSAVRAEGVRIIIWARLKKFIAHVEYRRYCIHLTVIQRLIHRWNKPPFRLTSSSEQQQLRLLVPASVLGRINDALKAIQQQQHAPPKPPTSPVEVLCGTTPDNIFNAIQSSLFLGAGLPQGNAACYWLLYLLTISPTAQMGFRTAISEISNNSLFSLHYGTCVSLLLAAEYMEELLNKITHNQIITDTSDHQAERQALDGPLLAELFQKLPSIIINSFDGVGNSKDYQNSRKQWLGFFHSARCID
jgi:hypothetical protein